MGVHFLQSQMPALGVQVRIFLQRFKSNWDWWGDIYQDLDELYNWLDTLLKYCFLLGTEVPQMFLFPPPIHLTSGQGCPSLCVPWWGCWPCPTGPQGCFCGGRSYDQVWPGQDDGQPGLPGLDASRFRGRSIWRLQEKYESDSLKVLKSDINI